MAVETKFCYKYTKYRPQILYPLCLFGVCFLLITSYLLFSLSNDAASGNHQIDTLFKENLTKLAGNIFKSTQMNAIVGGIVGDAASRPLHWIYSADRLNSIIETHPTMIMHSYLKIIVHIMKFQLDIIVFMGKKYSLALNQFTSIK